MIDKVKLKKKLYSFVELDELCKITNGEVKDTKEGLELHLKK